MLEHPAWSAMSPKPISTNALFYGDNLPILREYEVLFCLAYKHAVARTQCYLKVNRAILMQVNRHKT